MDNQLIQAVSNSSIPAIVISSLVSIFGIVSATLKIRSDLLKESISQNDRNVRTIKEVYHIQVEALKKEILELKQEKEEIKQDIENMEIRLEKRQDREIKVVKETYDSELKHLRQKVEELRDEVRTGNSQLIALLSKIVNH